MSHTTTVRCRASGELTPARLSSKLWSRSPNLWPWRPGVGPPRGPKSRICSSLGMRKRGPKIGSLTWGPIRHRFRPPASPLPRSIVGSRRRKDRIWWSLNSASSNSTRTSSSLARLSQRARIMRRRLPNRLISPWPGLIPSLLGKIPITALLTSSVSTTVSIP